MHRSSDGEKGAATHGMNGLRRRVGTLKKKEAVPFSTASSAQPSLMVSDGFSAGAPIVLVRSMRRAMQCTLIRELERTSGAFGSLSLGNSCRLTQALEHLSDLVKLSPLIEEVIDPAFAAGTAVVVVRIVRDDDDRLGSADPLRSHFLQQSKAAAIPQLNVENE